MYAAAGKAAIRRGMMNNIAQLSIAIAFFGILTLVVGHALRDSRLGPVMILAGIVLMLFAIAHYIVRTLA